MMCPQLIRGRQKADEALGDEIDGASTRRRAGSRPSAGKEKERRVELPSPRWRQTYTGMQGSADEVLLEIREW